MKIQSTQVPNNNSTIKTNNRQISNEFKIENFNLDIDKLLENEKYKPYTQYIKNHTKLSMTIYGASYDDAIKSVKLMIDNLDNPDFPGNNEYSSSFIPNGGPLSDELTNTLIETFKTIGAEKYNIMMIRFSADFSSPKPNDNRYFNTNGTYKNDPKYPINQYSKDKFEDNNIMLKFFKTVLKDLKQGAKEFGGDISKLQNSYEILIDKFTKEINKSENEKNILLKNITKNTKPNPISSNLKINNSSKLDERFSNIILKGGTTFTNQETYHKNNIKALPESNFFPKGTNLTDEFIDSMLSLSDEQFMVAMILIRDKTTPTLDDERYFVHSGKFGTSSYKIVSKNDPQFPISEYGKEYFESNKNTLSMLQVMLDKIIEDSKLYDNDPLIKNTFETLIVSLNDKMQKGKMK